MSFSTRSVEQPDKATAPAPEAPSTVRNFRRSRVGLGSSVMHAPFGRSGVGRLTRSSRLPTPDSRLIVTYRAISRDLPLDVASDAETHPVHVVHLEDLRHPLHVAMAGGAGIGTQGFDMPLMREVSMPGEIVHPHPFDRLLLRPRLPKLLDFRLVRAVPPPDHEVTSHTGLNR